MWENGQSETTGFSTQYNRKPVYEMTDKGKSDVKWATEQRV